MPAGDVGRAVKQKSGSLECYDLTVNGTLTLSVGKIQLKDSAGRLGTPASLDILDQDGVVIAKIIASSGNLEIRGNVVKQQ